MISDELLDGVIVALAGLIALAAALLVAHGAGSTIAGLAGGGRIRRARVALLAAARHGRHDPEVARALSAVPREHALALLDELAPSLAGAERSALTAAARERGLIAHAESGCASRRWRRRLHAVRVLALLGGGEQSVPALLRDPRPEVRAQAAEWAADNPSEPVVERLVQMLQERERFARFTVMDSLIRLGPHAVEPLARAIASGGAGAATLEVAARIGDPRLAGPAQARVSDPDPQMRAWAARLLGGLGGERHTALVAGLLEDQAPEVRAAAAVALGQLGHWPSAPALALRLRDPVWRVRRDAALALRALRAPGELLLQRALRSDDAFARDMARQTLDLPEAVLPA